MNVTGYYENLLQVIKLSFHPKRPYYVLWLVNPKPAFGHHFAAHVYPKFIPPEKKISLVISTVNTILSIL
jgi:hypothetical protein